MNTRNQSNFQNLNHEDTGVSINMDQTHLMNSGQIKLLNQDSSSISKHALKLREEFELSAEYKLTRDSTLNPQNDQELLFTNVTCDKTNLHLEVIQENEFQVEEIKNNQGNFTRNNIPDPVRAGSNNVVEVPHLASEEEILWQNITKLYLYKIAGFSLTAFLLLAAFLFNDNTNDNYAWFFLITNIYYLYCAYIDYFVSRKMLGDMWVIDNNHISNLVNVILYSVTFMLIYLKFFKIIPYSLISCVPFGLGTILCLIFFPSRSSRLKTNSFRIYFTVQILLSCLKIDEFISWDWELVFLPSFIYFSKGSFLCLNYAFSLMKIIREMLIKQPNFGNSANKTKLIGSFWGILYYGLCISGILALFGVGQAYNSENIKDFTILKIAGYLGLIESIILFAYILITRKVLIQFVVLEKVMEIYLIRSDNPKKQKQKRIVILEAEKKEELFIMISPTYFLSIQQSSQSYEINKEASPQGQKKLIVDGEGSKEIESSKPKPLSPTTTQENSNCYICFNKQPDVIFISCGHGGICYECASAIVEKKDECTECRKKVEAIFRIQPDPVVSNIYKGIEFHKLLLKVE